MNDDVRKCDARIQVMNDTRELKMKYIKSETDTIYEKECDAIGLNEKRIIGEGRGSLVEARKASSCWWLGSSTRFVAEPSTRLHARHWRRAPCWRKQRAAGGSQSESASVTRCATRAATRHAPYLTTSLHQGYEHDLCAHASYGVYYEYIYYLKVFIMYIKCTRYPIIHILRR